MRELGARVRDARLARLITQSELAERVGVSRPTIAKLEAGEANTSIATFITAMSVLGFERDIDKLMKDDPIGRDIAYSFLPRPGRSGRRS